MNERSSAAVYLQAASTLLQLSPWRISTTVHELVSNAGAPELTLSERNAQEATPLRP